MFLGIFPIACVRKKICIYVFLGIFQNNREKKKKKNFVQERIWATAQLYCEKKKLYCNLGFVLHEKGLNGRNYIVT